MNTVENWNIGGGTCINVKELKVRNSIIVQAYEEGYSQQMIAKVLKITQQNNFMVESLNPVDIVVDYAIPYSLRGFSPAVSEVVTQGHGIVLDYYESKDDN